MSNREPLQIIPGRIFMQLDVALPFIWFRHNIVFQIPMLCFTKFTMFEETVYISKIRMAHKTRSDYQSLYGSLSMLCLDFYFIYCNFPGAICLPIVDACNHTNLSEISSVPGEKFCFHRNQNKYRSSGETWYVCFFMWWTDLLLADNFLDHLFHRFV